MRIFKESYFSQKKTVLKRYPNLKEDDNPEPLEKDPDNSTIVAGPYMLSKDAVRIGNSLIGVLFVHFLNFVFVAKYGTHGAERDESIQRHVGFWVQEPFNVPFYEPGLVHNIHISDYS